MSKKKHATLRWIWRISEFQSKESRGDLPAKARGFYALLDELKPRKKYHVVYVGIADDLKRRLGQHATGSKARKWSHFSVFQVWPNITEAEIREIEGILRHVYRKDPHANDLNEQRRMHMLGNVKVRLIQWTNEIPIRGASDGRRERKVMVGAPKRRKRRHVRQ